MEGFREDKVMAIVQERNNDDVNEIVMEEFLQKFVN